MATDNKTTQEIRDDNPQVAAVGDEIAAFRTGQDDIGILTEDISKMGLSSVTAGITAFSGGGQGSAVELITTINKISTVAAPADSVKLDAAVAAYSKRRTILNNGVSACDVFPGSSDDIGAGVDTAVSLAAGANITYESYDATNWFAVT